MLSIKYPIVLVLGVALLVVLIMNVYPAITNVSVSNVSQSLNNVAAVTLANSPIYVTGQYSPTLAYANGTAVSNFTYTASTVILGSNIANGTYYESYVYYKEPWIGGTNYAWVIVVLVFIGFIAAALKVLDVV